MQQRPVLPVISIILICSLQAACSSEQLRANSYQALHKRQQLQCLQAGRHDCAEYESYPEYRTKLEELKQ